MALTTFPSDARVLFIGGNDAYKLGPTAASIAYRHRNERWIHMGRVNSQKRFRVARSFGCHSADGTFLTYGPKVNLPRTLSWIVDELTNPMIWEEAS